MSELRVWRFDSVEYRSHVIAESQKNAEEIFSRTMGPIEEDECDIYPIDGSEVLLISEDGNVPFKSKTADEWIADNPSERFL